ncbi:MAG TPA: hypothetical protein PLS83_07225 [Methanothrix soehngenii]|nr:hypothetical protein [Methanothrix soehngenii]
MSEGPVFQIGEQHAGRDIYNVARDLNISKDSSSEDVLKVIEAIRQKVGELDIEEKEKRKIGNHLENAKIELEDENPDKSSFAESIRQANEVLKDAKTTGENLKEIGTLFGKAAVWLGTTAAKLGWIF